VIGAKGAEDVYRDWARIREIHEAGALLVRPDGYIAWRQTTATWDDNDALNQLQSALAAVLSADY
jgi:2,4-dichlorophenol 6-monooxygenase